MVCWCPGFVTGGVSCARNGDSVFKQLREPVNGLTHPVAAVAAAVGLAALLYRSRGDVPKQVSLLVYASSLVLMFSASATYHLVQRGPHVGQFLRKLGHSSIYLLIAGTYTPISLHFFARFWQWGMITIVWSMACIEIAVKLFIPNAPRWITAAIYLLMG